MKSASIRIFCTPAELSNWLKILCTRRRLGSVTFQSSRYTGTVTSVSADIKIMEDTYAVFLFPSDLPPSSSLTLNEVNARQNGWITIQPGRLLCQDEQKILLLSQVTGEDFGLGSVDPVQTVRWLQKYIGSESKTGVIGVNMDNNGQSTYRYLRYTERAEQLRRSGTLWKQFMDGKVTFFPFDLSTVE